MISKRFLSAILALFLLASLVLPVSAASASGFAANRIRTKSSITEDCMVYPLARTIDMGFTVGQTTELTFKLNGATPRKDDKLCIEIYGDDLSGDLFYQKILPVSKFDKNGKISVSWKPDNTFHEYQEYTLACMILTADEELYEQAIFLSDLYQVESKKYPTRMDCGYVNNGGFSGTVFVDESDSGTVGAGETIVIVPLFWWPGTYSSEPLTATADAPDVAKVWVEDGFIMAKGLMRGSTKIKIKCDYFQTTFTCSFGEPVDFKLTHGNTDLCVGATDKITATASQPGDPVYYTWSSSDPSIATVKDGLVTALKPGEVTIYTTAYSITHTVRYTIKYHELPENTPVTGPTATQPKQAVGHCSVCGKDDAANVFEPAIFTDTVWNSWYAPHVDKVYDAGLMKGTGEHTFAPNANVTRAMAATVLYRVAGEPEVEGEIPFSDVPEGKYYTNAVIWAAQNEIVNGYPDGTFRPDTNITREQLAAILYRSASKNDHVLAEIADLSGFPDASDVHAYAIEAMGWAVGAGLINGVGSGGKSWLQPANNATRAQFATIISRYMTALEENEERPENPEAPSPADPGSSEVK